MLIDMWGYQQRNGEWRTFDYTLSRGITTKDPLWTLETLYKIPNDSIKHTN